MTTLSCKKYRRSNTPIYFRITSLSLGQSYVKQPWRIWSMVAPIWAHDDAIKWKQFPHYWPFVRGIHRSPVNFPHKGQWRGTLMFSLICAWINGWANNRETSDLRRHRAHYDVTVMNISCKFTDSWLYNHKKTKHNKTKCIFNGANRSLWVIITWMLNAMSTHLPWTKCPPFRRRYFQMNFVNEKFCILIKMSLKFGANGPMDNNPALV